MPEQGKLLELPAVEKPPVYDDERARALEGHWFYWRISWGYSDVIIHRCGHQQNVAVSQLENPEFKHPACPYKEWGGCNGKATNEN